MFLLQGSLEVGDHCFHWDQFHWLLIFSFLWYLWIESLGDPRRIGSREAWRCGGLGVFWWRLRVAQGRRSCLLWGLRVAGWSLGQLRASSRYLSLQRVHLGVPGQRCSSWQGGVTLWVARRGVLGHRLVASHGFLQLVNTVHCLLLLHLLGLLLQSPGVGVRREELVHLPPAGVKTAPADTARETEAGEDEEDEDGDDPADHGQQGQTALLPVWEVRGQKVHVAAEGLSDLLLTEHIGLQEG